MDFLDGLRDSEKSSLTPSAFATAVRVAEEYKLGMWVRQRNLAGGSIRTARLIEEYQQRLADRPPPVALRSMPTTAATSTRRNWALRWRRGQGARWAKLRTQEKVSLHEKREKAWGTRVIT